MAREGSFESRKKGDESQVISNDISAHEPDSRNRFREEPCNTNDQETLIPHGETGTYIRIGDFESPHHKGTFELN